jgi:ABC-type methionine transport system permease subunit
LNPAVTALAVSDALLADAISPELVLVSPPEVARIARAQLREVPRNPIEAAPPAERVNGPRALEFVAVYLICLLVTLGPLLFVIFSEPVRHVAEL